MQVELHPGFYVDVDAAPDETIEPLAHAYGAHARTRARPCALHSLQKKRPAKALSRSRLTLLRQVLSTPPPWFALLLPFPCPSFTERLHT
mmetsp:Transcript_9299/g.20370  ORF Transcript_9299/g.20370 Transcript_9299/m.20370 type:complete len:90 (+) Transcript_9299:28-297(+)